MAITCPEASSFYPSTIKTRVAESVRWRVKMEKKIMRSLIIELLDQGCSLSVYDGGETTLKKSVNRMDILYSLSTTDEDHLIVHNAAGKRLGAFRLIYGEDGYDVICDYSTALEGMFPITQALIDKLGNQINPRGW